MNDTIELVMFPESVKIDDYTGKQEKIICEKAKMEGLTIDRLNDGCIIVRCWNDDKTPLWNFMYEVSKEYNIKVE